MRIHNFCELCIVTGYRSIFLAKGELHLARNFPPGRIDQLTGLRFFAAFLVFLSHQTWDGAYKSFFEQGYVGVSFFFVLSGFVLSFSYANKLRDGRLSRRNYVMLRLARLTPLHYLTALPFLFLSVYAHHFHPFSSLLNLLYLESWAPSSSYYFALNGPSWSLSDEMFFYFMFAFLVFLSFKSRLIITLLMLLIIILSASIVETEYAGSKFFGEYTFSHWFFYIFPGFRLLEFLVGMTIFDLWKEGRLKFFKISWLAIPLLVATMFFAKRVPESFRVSLYFLPFVSLLLIAYLNGTDGFSFRLFASRPLVLLGEASFAFYLIHQPITIWGTKLFPLLSGNRFLFASILLLVTCLASIALFYIYERPAERFLKSKVLDDRSLVYNL